jgi:hypothetical protein
VISTIEPDQKNEGRDDPMSPRPESDSMTTQPLSDQPPAEASTTVETPAPERKKCYWNRVPDEMKQANRWLNWKYVQRPGKAKPDKVPIQVDGRLASSTDPSTRTTFGAVRWAYNELRCGDGIGFVLGDGWVGFDCDDSKDPSAPILQRILDSYTEDSPSGMGFHVICRGTLPPGGRRKGCYEMYDSGRYFTVTGDAWSRQTGELEDATGRVEERTAQLAEVHKMIFGVVDEKPTAIAAPPSPSPSPSPVDLSDADILATALRDAKFARLWSGAWEGMYRSHSEADQSLCNKLVFYFGGDAGKVDALFRQSGLMRPKWNREKYRTGTIEKALADVTKRYRPGIVNHHPTFTDALQRLLGPLFLEKPRPKRRQPIFRPAVRLPRAMRSASDMVMVIVIIISLRRPSRTAPHGPRHWTRQRSTASPARS